jgi:ankyrin repeat protein
MVFLTLIQYIIYIMAQVISDMKYNIKLRCSNDDSLSKLLETDNNLFIYCCKNNLDSVSRKILKIVANNEHMKKYITVQDNDKKTPLMYLINNRNKELCTEIINSGMAQLEHVDNKNRNALIYACTIPKPLFKVAKLIITFLKVNPPNGITSLEVNPEGINHLIKDHKKNINQVDSYGYTALSYCIKTINTSKEIKNIDKYYDLIKYLIENNANLKHIDKHGNTPLILACRKENRRYVRYLANIANLIIVVSKNDCLPNHKNNKNESALLLCMKKNNKLTVLNLDSAFFRHVTYKLLIS